MNTQRSMTFALLLASGWACRGDDQRTGSMDPDQARQERESLPPAVTAQLDSGSTAFRDDDFEAARRHYLRATELAPLVASGWFGVYMAEQALGNEEAARAALERARSAAPGATLIHPGPSDTSGALPPDTMR